MIQLDRRVVVAPADWEDLVRGAFADHTKFGRLAKKFEALPLHCPSRRRGFRKWLRGRLAEFCVGSKGFPPVWSAAHASVKKMSAGWCAYCQSDASASQFGDIDHWWPKSRFPRRAYDCGGYFLACRACNAFKGSKWPKGAAWVRPDDTKRDPSARFVFQEDGHVAAKKGDRGARRTIEDFRLDRKGLVKRRRQAIQKELATVRGVLAAMQKVTDAAVRTMLAEVVKERMPRGKGLYTVAIRQCVERELTSVKLLFPSP